ncbi:MAG: GTP-binding protein [Verrucomicrobiales bacterium]|nr:GTP-binding protein [Verrucomicrobiales bacterium]
MTDSKRIPVTILTGFLGAGKTTLLNRILSERHGQRVAVIENEFGEIGIDHELVIRSDEEIFEMNNGCICCTVRGDLIRVLGNLLKRRDKFDHILIETTGLADPGPVIQTFFADDDLKEALLVDAVVTLVDAKHVLQHLDDSPEVKQQIAFADIVLLNKVDLVADGDLPELEGRVRAVNPLARFYRTTNADIDINKVLNVGAFDLDRIIKDDPHFLTDADDDDEDEHEHHHHHEHGADCQCGCHEHDHDHDTDGDHEHHHHHRHYHDKDVQSVGIEHAGEVDGMKLNRWLSQLLATKGPDIYRMKGVFTVSGQKNRVIFQGVHMMLDAQPEADSTGKPRKCALVFIGKNLDRAALTKGFRECVV